MKSLFTFIIFCCVSIPSLLYSRTTIAVYDFFNQTQFPGIGLAVAEGFILPLSENENFMVVERSQMGQIQKEIQLGYSGLADMKTVARLGKQLGAQYVILGAVDEEVDLWGLRIYVFNVEKDTLENLGEDIGWNLYELIEKIIPRFSGKISRGIVRDAYETPAPKREAFIEYAHALYFTEQDRVEEAIKAVENSLRIDPHFHLAEKLLKKLEKKLLLYLKQHHDALNIWYQIPLLGTFTQLFVNEGGGNNPLKLEVSSQSMLMSGFTGIFTVTSIKSESKLFWLFAPFTTFFTYNMYRSKRVERKIADIKTRRDPSYAVFKVGGGLHYFQQPLTPALKTVYNDVYEFWQADSFAVGSSMRGIGVNFLAGRCRVMVDWSNKEMAFNTLQVTHYLKHDIVFPEICYYLRKPGRDRFSPYIGAGIPFSVLKHQTGVITGLDTTRHTFRQMDYGYAAGGGINFIWASDISFDLGVRYFYLPGEKSFAFLDPRKQPDNLGGLVVFFKVGLFGGR